MSVGPCVLYGWGMCGAHAALARDDEAGSLDDARARDLLFALGGVGLSLHNVLSESPACSRGLRWPRRDVSGYWQKRCLFAHWLIIIKIRLRFIRFCKSEFSVFPDHGKKTNAARRWGDGG